MDSALPLSPWASDGIFLIVRRLPGWPQAMWGYRRSYRVTSAVRRFVAHASWRTFIQLHILLFLSALSGGMIHPID